MIKTNKDIQSTETINIDIDLSLPTSEVDIDKLFMTRSYANIVQEAIKKVEDESDKIVLQIGDADKLFTFSEGDINNIIFTIKSIRYNNPIIIACPKIGSYLQEASAFSFKTINNAINIDRSPYITGNIEGMDTYVDPNQHWNEDKIIIIDGDIEINTNVSESSYYHRTSSPYTSVFRLEYGYRLPKSTTIYLYHDEKSSNYGKYLTHIRDKRIDDILS